jgi:VWFA-related protein
MIGGMATGFTRAAVVLLAIGFAGTVAVTGQTPAPAPTFRSGTDVVEVDVQVIDKAGKPITGLGLDDFTLTVDGTRRPVSSVDELTFRIDASDTPEASDPAELAVRAASYSSNAGTLPGRMYVLAIDQGNMSQHGGRGAMEAVSRFLDQLSPADRVALITLPAGPGVEFTSEHGLVKAAVAKITGGGASRYDGSYFRELSLAESFSFVTGSQRRLFQEAVSDECNFARTQAEMLRCQQDLENEARNKVMAAHQAEQGTLMKLEGLFDRLATIDGQKYVVFLGQGLVTGASFGYLDGIGDLKWIGDKAQEARVTMYVLQFGNAFLNAFDVSERRMTRTPVEDSRLLDDGLSMMAGAAGGAFFRLMTALDPAFERISRETSSSYILRFDVLPADRDGKSHSIGVKVERSGVEVRARKSFAASGTEASTGRRLGLALKAPFVPHALTIDIATPVMREPGAGASRLLLAAEIGCGPAPPASADVAVALTTADGVTRSLPPESVSSTVSRGTEQCLYYTSSLRVPAGDATVRLAAVSNDGRSGAVDRPITAVAAEGHGLRLGPLALTDPATRVGGKMKLVVDGTVRDRVAAYVEASAVSPEAAIDGLRLRVEIATSASSPALVTETPALVEDGAGQWYAETVLDLAPVPPGEYVVRAIASASQGELARTGRLLRKAGETAAH